VTIAAIRLPAASRVNTELNNGFSGIFFVQEWTNIYFQSGPELNRVPVANCDLMSRKKDAPEWISTARSGARGK
jgi:hypothetical protein